MGKKKVDEEADENGTSIRRLRGFERIYSDFKLKKKDLTVILF